MKLLETFEVRNGDRNVPHAVNNNSSSSNTLKFTCPDFQSQERKSQYCILMFLCFAGKEEHLHAFPQSELWGCSTEES